MTTWTESRDWIVGEIVTKDIMDTYIRDNLNYLYAHTLPVFFVGNARIGYCRLPDSSGN